MTVLKVWSTVKIRRAMVPQNEIVPVGRPRPYSIIILNMRLIPKASLRASSQITDLILLDFSKASVVVPRKRFLHKLDHYGIMGPTLLWIQNFLTTRTQKVVVDGSFWDTAHVGFGAPQGTVGLLGPILFLCYINDLTSSVSSDVRLFVE